MMSNIVALGDVLPSKASVEDACKDFVVDHEGVLRRVVVEYEALISGLTCLTSELPTRLLTRECGNSLPRNGPAFETACFSSGATTTDVSRPETDDLHDLIHDVAESLRDEDDSCMGNELTKPSFQKASPAAKRKARSPKSVNNIVASLPSLDNRNLEHSGDCMRFLAHICPCCFRSRTKTPTDEDNSLERRNSFDRIVADRLFAGAEAAIESLSFDLVVGIVIVANSVMMMMQLEYRGDAAANAIGLSGDTNYAWNNARKWFDVLEHVFNAAFLLEMFTRFIVYGRNHFKDVVLLFDVALVVMSSIQLYIFDQLETHTTLSTLSIFKMLRFVRLVRVLRIVRALRMFSALRVLVKTIISSFGALFYSLVLLFLMIVIAGFVLCELLLDYIKDDTKSYSTRLWVYKYYGTPSRAVYTLFEVTLAGCWPNYFRPLIHDVSPWFVLFAMIYVSFVVFAVIRIITAIFLKHTLSIASNDADMMVTERFDATQTYTKKLKTLFEAVDISGDGKLNEKEFETIVQNPRVRSWMHVLDLEIYDAKALFHLLDNGHGEVTFADFLNGILRLKGQARTMDVVSIMHKTDVMLEEIKGMCRKVDKLMK